MTTFSNDEKVLAFDGGWMFVATIISPQKIIQKNRKGYRVHFDGWPISEDKDIREDDILKINEEALAIKAQIESLDPRHDRDNGLALQANSADFDKNEKVLAYWSGQMYSGKIVDVNGKKRK